MKKIYFIKLLLLISTFVSAQNWPTIQYYTTVYTRNLTAIESFHFYPLSSNDYSASLSYIQQNYPNVTILENPTSEYNCYSYAFHLSEGNTSKLWINPQTTNGSSNLSNYWTDGSFIEVCNESDADKAYYYAGDHAALTTSSISGQYESKWGANCRVIHSPTYCPYDPGQFRRRYFASTKINGDPSNLCSGTRTFTVKNISGATYSWTYSSSLSAVGPINANQITVQRNGSSNGSAWVEVQISASCSSISPASRMDFSVGVPTTTCQEIGAGTCTKTNALCPSQMNNWQYVIIPGTWGIGGTGYHLQVNGGGYFNNGLTTQDITSNSFSVYVPSSGNNTTIWAMNSCGVSQNVPYVVAYYQKSYGCYGGYYTVAPNPANSSMTVSLDENNIDKAYSSFDEVRIYDQQGNLKIDRKFSKVSSATINVGSLFNGTYVVEISDGNYKERQQLVIQK